MVIQADGTLNAGIGNTLHECTPHVVEARRT